MRSPSYPRRRAFTLTELLVVVSLVSCLSALLYPAFLTVRGRARQSVCLSNLHQIGAGIAMYVQDYDGFYPHAVDPADRADPTVFDPEFADEIPRIGLLHEVLQPYVHSPQLFACPSDIGFTVLDSQDVLQDTFPSSFERYGTSYYYRTEIAAEHAGEMTFGRPAEVNVLSDGVGHWHGTLVPITPRYNTLFADGHVKNLSYNELQTFWSSTLNGLEPEDELENEDAAE